MIKLQIAVSPVVLKLDTKPLRAALRAAGAEVAAVVKANIRRSAGGGKTYYRDGKRYQASAPSQSPVSVSGELARSIKVRPFRSGDGVTIKDAAERENAFYSLFLEEGAVGGGRRGGKGLRNLRRKKKSAIRSERQGKPQTTRVLKPRPFLSTALAVREASIVKRLKVAIDSGTKFVRVKA